MPQKILIGLWLLGLHLLSAEASSSFRTARLRNLLGFGIGTDLGTPPPTMAPTMGSVSLGIVPTAGTTPPVTVGTTVGTTPPVTVGTTPPITVGPTAPVTADTAWNPNEYTFQYKIYTNSTDHVAEVVDSVDKAAIESLQFLFTTQSNILASDLNMSNHATLKNVSSRVLGPCDGNASENNAGTGTLPFADFAICNLVEANVDALVDTTALEPTSVRDSSLEYIQNDFVLSFNENSTSARLIYDFPITISSKLYILLIGVQRQMNDSEAKLFMKIVKTGVTGILNSTTSEQHPDPLQLWGVKLVNQDNSKKNRLLTRRLAAATTEDNDKIELLMTARCEGAAVYTNETLQNVLNTDVCPSYGTALQVALRNSEFSYFHNITGIQIYTSDNSTETNSNPPPATVQQTDESSKRGMPKWAWILLTIIGVIVALILSCFCFRFTIECIQGQRLDDPEENASKRTSSQKKNRDKDSFSHIEKRGSSSSQDVEKNNKNSSDFIPAPAPTVTQVQDMEREDYRHREQYYSTRNVQVTSNSSEASKEFDMEDHRLETKQERYYGPTKEQLNEEDYDEASYDDEYSVDAGNFTVADDWDDGTNRRNDNSRSR